MTNSVETLQRLRDLSKHLPLYSWDKRPTFEPGLSPLALASLPLSTPSDLRVFLAACSEILAGDIHNGYFIGGNLVLQAGSWPELTQYYEDAPLLPIATDGGGNAFLLSLAQPHPVFKWQHETSRLDPVCTGFTEFLDRVACDWKCYIDGTVGHDFISG